MKEITQQYLKEIFDYKEGFLYWKVNQGFNKIKNNKAGTLDKSNGYYKIGINNKRYYNHRLIFLYHHNYLPKFIDHIDRNKSNNKIENLRSVTQSQNNMNSKKRINTLSQYKGVSFDKIENKWIAYIRINNKKKHLGRFTNEKDAAITYNNAAIKYYGDYAYLNEV